MGFTKFPGLFNCYIEYQPEYISLNSLGYENVIFSINDAYEVFQDVF